MASKKVIDVTGPRPLSGCGTDATPEPPEQRQSDPHFFKPERT
jgi:hypothetical protein